MSGIPLISGFDLKGKQPNFDRDSFGTLAEMKAYPGEQIDEGHVSYCVESGERYMYRSENEEDETTGRWRAVSAKVDRGCYVFLEGNDTGENVLDASMMRRANRCYVIAYDFDLMGGKVTVPEGCTLFFMGGSILNGELEGQYTRLEGNVRVYRESRVANQQVVEKATLTGTWLNFGTSLVDKGRCKGDSYFDETGGCLNVWNGTQWDSYIKGKVLTRSEYNAIGEYDPDMVYFIKG